MKEIKLIPDAPFYNSVDVHVIIFACLLDKLGSRQCEVKISIGYFHLVCRYACLTFSLPKESAMPSFKVLSSSTIRIFIRHPPAL